MSKILKRPMFRGGGTVSSYGNGIATGLGYADGGQIGGGVIHGEKMGNRYGFAEPVIDKKKARQEEIIKNVQSLYPDLSLEEQIKIAGEELGKEDLFLDRSGIGSVLKFGGNLLLDATSSVMDTAINVPINSIGRLFGYNPGLSANKNVEDIKTSLFGDQAEIYDPNDPDRDEDANPQVAEFFGLNTNAKNTGEAREDKAKELLEIANENAAQAEIEKRKAADLINQNKQIENMYGDGKTDTDVMKDYMEMFSEAYGTDPEELKRSKYLELAKFGANLLAQPGGSLSEAIGRAASPSIEGLTAIAKDEREGQRQLKGVAMQAAMKKMDNPYLEKITTMSKLTGKPGEPGYKSPADIINLEFVNASAQRDSTARLKMNIDALVSVYGDEKDQLSAAQQIADIGKNIGDFVVIKTFEENPGDLEKGQLYMAKNPSGVNYLGKWDGRQFIFPGSDKF
tara:strand:- start:3113 stop:4474 length:1362 start_codon:yes stop_codon:yes gene_type:complete